MKLETLENMSLDVVEELLSATTKFSVLGYPGLGISQTSDGFEASVRMRFEDAKLTVVLGQAPSLPRAILDLKKKLQESLLSYRENLSSKKASIFTEIDKIDQGLSKLNNLDFNE